MSGKRALPTALTAPLLAAALILSCSPAAQAAPTRPAGLPSGLPLAAGVTVSPDGVIDYGFNLAALPGAEVDTEQGSRTPDGNCQFETHGVERPAAHAQVLMIRALSFDPATCTQRVARARYDVATMPASAAAVLAAGKPSGPKVQSRTERSSKAAPGGATHAAATAGWFGYLRTTVTMNFSGNSQTSEESELNWWNDGSSLHTSIWSWTPDFTLQAYARQFINNGISAITNTLGFFVGSCLLTTLTTEHNPSFVEGFFDGGFTYGYRMSVNGACAQLASFNHDVFWMPSF